MLNVWLLLLVMQAKSNSNFSKCIAQLKKARCLLQGEVWISPSCRFSFDCSSSFSNQPIKLSPACFPTANKEFQALWSFGGRLLTNVIRWQMHEIRFSCPSNSPSAFHTRDLLTHNRISLVCRVPLDPSRLRLLHMLVTARLSVSGAQLHSIMHFGSTPADVPKRSDRPAEIFSLRGASASCRLVSGGDPCLWLQLKDGLNFWVDPDHEWITGRRKKKNYSRSSSLKAAVLDRCCSQGGGTFSVFVLPAPTRERRGEGRVLRRAATVPGFVRRSRGASALIGRSCRECQRWGEFLAALKLLREAPAPRERPSARSFRVFRADLLSSQANYDFRNVSACSRAWRWWWDPSLKWE